MANNCLVTKLKGVVDNDNLLVLNTVVLKVTPLEDYTINDLVLQLSASGGDLHVKAVGGGGFSTHSNLSDPFTEYTISDGTIQHLVYVIPGTYKVYIEGKYNLTHLYVGKVIRTDVVQISGVPISEYLIIHNPYGNIDDINPLSSNIKYLGFYNNGDNLYGNISKFNNIEPLIEFVCNNCSNIVGDIVNLAKSTSINKIEIKDSGVYGSVEDFVNGQIENGRMTVDTNKPIRISSSLIRNLTFGGNHYKEGLNLWLTWESSSKIAIYTGSSTSDYTKVYCKGYTQSEAETKWPNKTIIRVDA